MSIREGDPNSSTETEFHLKESITAFENEKSVFEKAWDNHIKSDLM
jgi:hypothetical protein